MAGRNGVRGQRGVRWNRFIAPIAWPRRRSGIACTEAYPPERATAATYFGHRSATCARSGARTWRTVRKASMQGPWSACSCSSSIVLASSLDAATGRSSPWASASSNPAASAASSATQWPTSWSSRSMTS